jgi:hypothetical protein
MKITDYFERIYIINLPSRTDRRLEMERELCTHNISSRIKRIRFFPAIRPTDTGLFPSLGARGCFMSHLGILSEARRDGLANILVMEDDLSIAPQFAQSEAAMLEGLRSVKWDIAYFGHAEPAGGNPDAPTWKSSSQPMQCLHFYALNMSIITPLHDYLRACLTRVPGHPDGGPMHVDGAYSMFRMRHPNVLTLMASRSLGGQRSSRSDIASNKWYDRTPVLRELASIARRGKNWRALR